MPQGDKRRYTDKQKRKAAHIEQSYEARGVPEKEAQARAWATVNRDSGGGNLSGSGRGKPESHAAARRKQAARSAAARKGWETRRKRANG
ncbi:plasmid stabilization protein [Sphingobium sp.]|uniref:plasmid stabilization protein n=1 Tax=Sphingobium sp. TaxID=1912891 RepID=UPI002609AC14|nr:plasmid stabilization protein [Sphingobium sp.]